MKNGKCAKGITLGKNEELKDVKIIIRTRIFLCKTYNQYGKNKLEI